MNTNTGNFTNTLNTLNTLKKGHHKQNYGFSLNKHISNQIFKYNQIPSF